MGHVKALEKTSCKYPVRRVEVKVDTVPTGNMNYVQDNMFLGQLPKRLVIACVDSDALNSANGKKSVRFQTLRSILWHSTLTDDRFQRNQLRKQWLHPKLYGTLHQYRKNGSRRRKYHFQRRLCQRKHLFWIWSHTRHVWSWSLSAHKTRQLESGESFRRNPYNYHQRDHVCRIWQRHWNW